MIGPHLGLMRPVAIIEFRMALGQTIRKAGVALARSWIPPAAHFARMPRIAQIQDHIKLIVVRIRGIEVRRPRSQVRELAVDEPHTMDAARIWSRRIEEGKLEILQALGVSDALQIRYVQHP